MSVLNLLTALKDKMRSERLENPVENVIESFEKLPEISRLEDVVVGALLNE
jgi:hypothetical protein